MAEYEQLTTGVDLVPYINQRIAPFVVKGRLGEGGIGQIFIAEDLSGKATRAIKVLKEDKSDPTLIKRFRLEFDLLHSLNHPCLLKVYEFHSGELSFFTMEHIQGKTLTDEFQIQNKGATAENEVIHSLIDVTLQCLETLHYLHTRHIIHRDLKPANIMIQPNGKIKILDFGVARRQDSDLELTQRQEIIGTFEYMAPEVLAGYTYDHRIDLYSLGVILYRVLSGNRMFEVFSFLDMFKAKSHEESPLLEKKGLANFEWFVDLINQLTMRVPQKRCKSASEAIHWMENYYSTSHILARMQTPLSSITSPLLSVRNAPLFDRSEPISVLKNWLKNAQHGNLMIHGNSGTGKSRMVSYLYSEGRLRGIPVIVLDAQMIVENKSFFTQAFELLHQNFFPETRNPVYSQDMDWTWSSGVFNSFLSQCGWDSNFVVIVDDFHLLPRDAHKEIGSFFQMSTKQDEQIRISWVFSYSDELAGKLLLEEGISLLELIPKLEDVALKPLTSEKTRELASYLLAETHIDDNLAREVMIYSNGLPFSIAHFLSILIEKNWLIRTENLWSLSNMAFSVMPGHEAPSDLGTGLISTQVGKLEQNALDLIRILSVLGEKVRFEIIEGAYESAGFDLGKAVSDLVIQQLVGYDGPLIYFSDHKIRKQVYEALTAEEKKSYHSRAMHLLEKHYGFEHPRHYLEFLFHANLAGELEKINQYSAGIGVFFFNRGMYEEGQQYFGNAIAHSDGKSNFLLVEFYFWKAECELSLFRLREAHSDFLTALKHLELMETSNTEKLLQQKDKIRLVIMHKIMLLEYQRQRIGEAENIRMKIIAIHKRLRPFIRDLKIEERLSFSQRQWADIAFPLRPNSPSSFSILKAIFRTLVEMNPMGNLLPGLASGWHWDDKTRKLTFTLKKNIHYHNGALIRNEDVLFTIKVIREQDFYHLDLSGPAKRIQNYGVNSVGDIEITYHAGPPPNMIFWCRLFIIPSYLYNHKVPGEHIDPKRSFVGSGPYEVSQITSKGWGLKRIGSSKAQIKSVQVFSDFSDALNQLKNGGFQLAELHYRDWKKLIPTIQVNHSIIRDQIVSNQTYRLCFKLRSTRILPYDLRKALFQSLPLENWNTLYLDNKYVVPRLLLLRTQSTEGQSQLRKVGGHEVEKAMKKMGASLNAQKLWCLDGKPIVIRMLLPKNSRLKKVFRAIVIHWKTLGIDVQVAWRDFNTFGKWITNEKVDAWIDYIHVDPSYEGLADYLHEKSYPNGANFVGYKSDEMNALLTALQNTPIHRRKSLMLRIDAIFAKETPWFPLFQPKYFYAFSTQLGGIQPSNRGLLYSSKQFEDLHSLSEPDHK